MGAASIRRVGAGYRAVAYPDALFTVLVERLRDEAPSRFVAVARTLCLMGRGGLRGGLLVCEGYARRVGWDLPRLDRPEAVGIRHKAWAA